MISIQPDDFYSAGYVDQEVVLRDTGYLILYSLNQRRRLANINLGLEVPKQVIWNQDGTKVAILTSKVGFIYFIIKQNFSALIIKGTVNITSLDLP